MSQYNMPPGVSTNDIPGNEIEGEALTITRTLDGILYVVDGETGEVLSAQAPGFAVEDDDSAEWVLKRMVDAQSEIDSLEEHPDVQAARRVLSSPEVLSAQSALKGLGELQSEARARLDALHRRFDAELASYALAQLGEGDGRTKRFLWGDVSFRKTQGSVKVLCDATAVAFAKLVGLGDAIKESVSVSRIKPAVLSAWETLRANELDESRPPGELERKELLAQAFDIEPPQESKPTVKPRGSK